VDAFASQVLDGLRDDGALADMALGEAFKLIRDL
jgi:hypothetical protein